MAITAKESYIRPESIEIEMMFNNVCSGSVGIEDVTEEQITWD